MSEWASFLPLILIVVVFWFVIVRPARRRQSEANAVFESVEAGRQVMTTSGIFGQVVEVDDDTLRLSIADGVVIRMHRQAIGKVFTEPSTDESA